MSNQRISSVANPTQATDAANRQFVDKFDVPIGTLLTYWGISPPVGYLVCNGTTFGSGDYPELYAFLDNSNVLPNL